MHATSRPTARRFRLTAIVLSWMLLLQVIFVPPVVLAEEEYTVNDTFDSLTTGSTPPGGGGWSITTGGGEIEVVEDPSPQDKSIRITKQVETSGSRAVAQRAFDPLAGRLVIEFAMRTDDTSSSKLAYVYGDNGVNAIALSFDNAYMKTSNGNFFSFTPGQWYEMKIAINTLTDECSIYVDGQLAAQEPLRNAVEHINRINFLIDHTKSGSLYFNNLRVYADTTPQEPVELTAVQFEHPAYMVGTGASVSTVVKAVYSDASTLQLFDEAAYMSLNTSVATVGLDGMLTGVSPGTTQVTASYGGMTATADVVVAAAHSEYDRHVVIVEDDFDANELGVAPAGWQLEQAGNGTVTVEQRTQDATNSMYMNKTAASGNLGANKLIMASGKVVVELDLLSEETSGVKAAAYIYPSSGDTLISIQLDNGRIRAYDGSTNLNVQNFVAGQWYHLRIVMDTVAGTYDLYVDDALQAEGLAYRNPLAPGATVGKLRSYIGNNQSGTLYMDNFRAYTLVPLDGIYYDYSDYELNPDDTNQSVVFAHYVDGYEEDVTHEAQFASSDDAVATVSSGGLVTATGQGTATITASYGGQAAELDVTVTTDPVIVAISTSEALYRVDVGDSEAVIVTALYSDDSQADVTGQAVFSSSDPLIADIDEHGVLTGYNIGEAAITVKVKRATAIAAVEVPPTEADVSLNELADDPLLRAYLYDQPSRITSNIGTSGAISVNKDWERGEAALFYIEQQRYGGDMLHAGLISGNEDLIDAGKLVIDWGFARQDASGGFPGTGDAFHSTGLFLEAVARGVLLAKQINEQRYADMIADYTDKLHAGAHWMMRPENAITGNLNNAPYTHRRWVDAALFGMIAELSGDMELYRKSEAYAREGLSLMLPSGVNPEIGAFDVSYQTLGLILAGRYYTVNKNAVLRGEISDMIDTALRYAADHIDERGNVRLTGSLRTAFEKGRSGALKSIDYKNMVQALLAGAIITGNPEYEQIAWRMMKNIPYMTEVIDDFSDEQAGMVGWSVEGEGSAAAHIDPLDKPDGASNAAVVTFEPDTVYDELYYSKAVNGALWENNAYAVRVWLKDASVGVQHGLAVSVALEDGEGGQWLAPVDAHMEPGRWMQITVPFDAFVPAGQTFGQLEPEEIVKLGLTVSGTTSLTVALALPEVIVRDQIDHFEQGVSSNPQWWNPLLLEDKLYVDHFESDNVSHWYTIGVGAVSMETGPSNRVVTNSRRSAAITFNNASPAETLHQYVPVDVAQWPADSSGMMMLLKGDPAHTQLLKEQATVHLWDEYGLSWTYGIGDVLQTADFWVPVIIPLAAFEPDGVPASGELTVESIVGFSVGTTVQTPLTVHIDNIEVINDVVVSAGDTPDGSLYAGTLVFAGGGEEQKYVAVRSGLMNRSNNLLRLWVKGSSINEATAASDIQLHLSGSAGIWSYPIGDSIDHSQWTQLSIPFSDFIGVGPTFGLTPAATDVGRLTITVNTNSRFVLKLDQVEMLADDVVSVPQLPYVIDSFDDGDAIQPLWRAVGAETSAIETEAGGHTGGGYAALLAFDGDTGTSGSAYAARAISVHGEHWPSNAAAITMALKGVSGNAAIADEQLLLELVDGNTNVWRAEIGGQLQDDVWSVITVPLGSFLYVGTLPELELEHTALRELRIAASGLSSELQLYVDSIGVTVSE